MDEQNTAGSMSNEATSGGTAPAAPDRIASEMAADDAAQHGSNVSAGEMQGAQMSMNIGGSSYAVGNKSSHPRIPQEALQALAAQLSAGGQSISADDLGAALLQAGLTVSPDHWASWGGGQAAALGTLQGSSNISGGLPNVAQAALADRIEQIASSAQTGFVTLGPMSQPTVQAYTTGTADAVAALTDEREVPSAAVAGEREVPTEAGIAVQPSGDISSDLTPADYDAPTGSMDAEMVGSSSSADEAGSSPTAGSGASNQSHPLDQTIGSDATEPEVGEISGDAISMAEAGVGSALTADEASPSSKHEGVITGADEVMVVSPASTEEATSSPTSATAAAITIAPTMNEQEQQGDQHMAESSALESSAAVTPETSSPMAGDDLAGGAGTAAEEQPTIAMPPASTQGGQQAGQAATAVSAPRIILRSGVEFSLDKEEMIVGREDPVSDIFPDIDLTSHGGEEGGVSRRHARIIRDGDTFLLEDLNSTNYTKLNGVKLIPKVPQAMRDGDTISFGRVEARFSGNR